MHLTLKEIKVQQTQVHVSWRRLWTSRGSPHTSGRKTMHRQLTTSRHRCLRPTKGCAGRSPYSKIRFQSQPPSQAASGLWIRTSLHHTPRQPTKAQRAAMCAESAFTNPEAPLGPLASAWVDDLFKWYKKLQSHFKFDKANLAANVSRNAHNGERGCSSCKTHVLSSSNSS